MRVTGTARRACAQRLIVQYAPIIGARGRRAGSRRVIACAGALLQARLSELRARRTRLQSLLGYAIRHANFGMNGAFFTFGNAILNAFYPGYKWEANYLAGATSPGG
jgi:hypothetical protein